KIYNTRSVGHTGTLDPQATGLLIILLGEATKISEYLVGCDKSYEGTMRLGVVSDTYDIDGKIEPGPGEPIPPTIEALQEAANAFKGETQQIPPPFSAKKIMGKKLYQYAREGKVPEEIPPRTIRVDEIEIINFKDGVSEFGVDCASGTYIRSIVHDLGQNIGCGAILTELRRTDVGRFCIEDAHLLENLQDMTDEERQAALLPIAQAVPLPVFHLAPGAETWLRRGQTIPHSLVHSAGDETVPSTGSLVSLCRLNGEIIAIARVDPAPSSPPPKSMTSTSPPWYHPMKQFLIPDEGA
ncbi:MAG: tRNA pseudouridine(55) synthase TruB, partial [Candidatus Sumerlaeia bacterium]|nr:tRNA pseudouridine(55) synthase TruB [Candidatus Sumerlaeia bacterium]